MSSNNVSDIVEDKDGFMWIATDNGLNKFDGDKFTIFHKGDKDIEIFDDAINKLYIDSNQNLWINNYDGISRTNLLNKKDKFSIGNLTDVRMAWKDDKIFYTEHNGIFEVDNSGNIQKKSGTVRPHYFLGIAHNRLLKLYHHGQEKYATLPNSIVRLNENYEIDKEYTLPTKSLIQDLYFENNLCYVTCWEDHIYLLNLESGQFSIIPINNHSTNKVVAFGMTPWTFQDKTYIVVAGSSFLILIDNKSGEAHRYEQTGLIRNVFVDSKNNLWIAVQNEGIKLVSSIQETFRAIPIHNALNKIPDSYNYSVKHINNQYWISTRYNTGFYQFSENWDKIHHYGKNEWIKPEKYGGKSEHIDAFDFVANQGKVIASNDFGLYEIDPANAKIKFIKLDSFDIKLRNIIQINENSLLIRSISKGIYLYNIKDKKFDKLYKVLDDNNLPLYLNWMCKDNKGRIYVSSQIGLYHYDIKLDSFIKITHTPIDHTVIYQIAEDKNEILWISTHKGIFVFDAQRKSISSVEMINHKIARADNIQIDENNNVWMANDLGIHLYNQKNHTLHSIDKNLELFVTSNYTVLGCFDHKMYAGADNHILIIDIDKFEAYRVSSQIHLTSLLVNNIERLTSNVSNNFKFNDDERNLRIQFSAPTYSIAKNVAYSFRNFNEDSIWVDLKYGELYLPNLNYGKYHFQIRANNILTNEFSSYKDIYLTINYPWYQTRLFRIIASLLILTFFYLLYKYRVGKINDKMSLEKKYHETISDLEMKNLRSQMNPHFIFNSLNSINRYVIENKTHLASDYISKFSRLIRLILEYSKLDFITINEEIEVLKLYLHMEMLRFENEFNWKINIGDEHDFGNVLIPPLIVQPFVENAIWHGLRHQKKLGLVTINFEVDKINSVLTISIDDNGIGRIKASEYKSKSSTTNKSMGIDITLARLNLLNPNNRVEIIDLVDENKNALGTKVVISMNTVR